MEAARRLDDVTDDDRASLWAELGDAHVAAGEFGAAYDAYRHAYRLTPTDDVRRAAILLRLARARERAGAFVAALRNVNSGLKLLRGATEHDADKWRARLSSFAAMIRWGQEHNRDAVDRAERAIVMARAVDEREALAQALMVADVADLAVHGPGSGSRLQEALGIFVELGDLPGEAQARETSASSRRQASRWEEAIAWFTSAGAAFDRCGDVVGSAISTLNLGEILIKQFRSDEAEPLLVDAVRVLRSVGFSDGAAYAELQLARAWVDAGRYAEAEDALVRIADEFAAIGQVASRFDTMLTRAELLVRQADPAAAIELLARAEKEAREEAEQFTACPRSSEPPRSPRSATPKSQATCSRSGCPRHGSGAMPYEEALLVKLAGEIADANGREFDPTLRRAADETLIGLGVRLRDRSTTAF